MLTRLKAAAVVDALIALVNPLAQTGVGQGLPAPHARLEGLRRKCWGPLWQFSTNRIDVQTRLTASR